MGNHLATIDMGRKLGAVSLLGGGAGFPCNTMQPELRPSIVQSGILIHPAVWPQQTWAENWGRAVPPFLGRESWVPMYHNVAWAEAYLHTKWHLDPCSRLATVDMGRKLGAVPLGDGDLGLHLTLWPGPRPTCMPSFILICPTVWPQYTNVTDRTGQTMVR